MTHHFIHEDICEIAIGGIGLDLEARVTGIYYPYIAGVKEPGGMAIEPDESAHCDIEKIEVKVITFPSPSSSASIEQWKDVTDLFDDETISRIAENILSEVEGNIG